MKIYVPQDSAAIAMGADAVAAAIQQYAAEHNLDLTLIRNGSRGLLWLEPLVEIDTPQGRVGYGNVCADQARGNRVSSEAHELPDAHRHL